MKNQYTISFLLFVFSTVIVSGPCLGEHISTHPRMILAGITKMSLSLPPGSDHAAFSDCEVDNSISNLLVKFKPTRISHVFPDFDPDNYEKYPNIPPLNRFFIIHFENDLDVRLVSSQLKELSGVLFAEPNFNSPFSGDVEGTIGSTKQFSEENKILLQDPNDTFFSNSPHQWNLHDAGTGIGCQTAWAYTTGNPAVHIGNLDRKIWWNHLDLEISGGFMVTKNMIDPSIPFIIVEPDTSYSGSAHGTWSAGIIGAKTNNNTAVAGIAGGNGSTSGCSLFDLQLSTASTTPPINSALAWALAIEAAVDPMGVYNCDVINISMALDEYSETLRGAIRFAHEVGASIVASQSNQPSPNHPAGYPAAYDEHWLVAVGACDSYGIVRPDSRRGSGIDLVAPGSNCPTTTPPDFANPDFNGSNVKYYSQTSCATPHVAGSIALLRSFLGNSLSPNDYENILKLSSRDSLLDNNTQTWDSDYGHGRLNIGDALTYASQHSIIKFATPITAISEPDTGIVVFMSGPFEGKNTAIRYKVSGNISFGNVFTAVPKVWGPSEPPYFFGFYGLSNYSPNYGEPYHGIEETSVSQSGCIAYTYVYHIADNDGSFKYWYPANPQQIPVCAKAMGQTATKQKTEVKVSTNSFTIFPNPFNSVVVISFQLEIESQVFVDVIDLRGRNICKIYNNLCPSGTVKISWNGTDRLGHFVSSGTYFIKVKINDTTMVKKITLTK